MIRVLLDCRMASWAGVGRYTTGLARALAARDDLHLIAVCAPQGMSLLTPHPRTEIVAAAAHPFGIRGALELGRVVRSTRPDLIHCLHFPTPVPVRAPLVVTLHDLTPLVLPGVMRSSLKRLVYRRWNARAVRLAGGLIVPSRATEKDVAKIFPAARQLLTVIPEAADDFSSGSPGTLPDSLARLTSSPYLLSMGNTKPHKDLPTLLRAFVMAATSRPEIRLLLAGTEPPGYLQTHLAGASAGVRSRVVFTGPVDDDELRTLYAGAAVFVFPSRYEGFGLPVLEAMALGAPVVCADAASLPEVAADAARLFPAGDSNALATVLAQVLDDSSLRADLVEEGRRRSAQFSWERTGKATVATYLKVLEQTASHLRHESCAE